MAHSAKDIQEKEAQHAAEVGSLIGDAVCAVINYIDHNSQNNQEAVRKTFSKVARKLLS